MSEILNETFYTIRPDNTYRRQGRHIIIASMESLTPLQTTLDPSIWGVGNSEFTWGRVQKFFARFPMSVHNQMPMHYYAEYLGEDYVTYVGAPFTNKSWFLQEAVARGVIPWQYMDDILVVLQENYAIENVERRLWRVLAHTLLTPLMRQFDIPKERVVFFENLANVKVVEESGQWPFRFRRPVHLDPIQLQLFLKDFEKR